jgi:hypothetical protein
VCEVLECVDCGVSFDKDYAVLIRVTHINFTVKLIIPCFKRDCALFLCVSEAIWATQALFWMIYRKQRLCFGCFIGDRGSVLDAVGATEALFWMLCRKQRLCFGSLRDNRGSVLAAL